MILSGFDVRFICKDASFWEDIEELAKKKMNKEVFRVTFGWKGWIVGWIGVANSSSWHVYFVNNVCEYIMFGITLLVTCHGQIQTKKKKIGFGLCVIFYNRLCWWFFSDITNENFLMVLKWLYKWNFDELLSIWTMALVFTLLSTGSAAGSCYTFTVYDPTFILFSVLICTIFMVLTAWSMRWSALVVVLAWYVDAYGHVAKWLLSSKMLFECFSIF